MKKFRSLGFVLVGALFFSSALATVNTVDFDEKSAGGSINVTEFNKMIKVLRGLFVDDNDTTADYTDDKYGFGVATPSEKFEVSGNISATGFIGNGAQLTNLPDNRKFIDGNTTTDAVFSGGNVGIGRTDPTVKLEVSGDSAQLRVHRTSTVPGVEAAIILATQGNDVAQIRGVNGGGLRLANGTTSQDWVRIDSMGKVGIGTTNPEEIFEVYTTGADPTTTTQIVANRDSYGSVRARLKTYAGGTSALDRFTIGVGEANQNTFNILANGNIGIGTTSPATELDVNGIGRFQSPNNGSTGGVIIRDVPDNSGKAFLQFVNNNNSVQWGHVRASSGGLYLAGGSSEGVFVNTSGNVGIGTSNPTAKLDVVGDIVATGSNTTNDYFGKFVLQRSGIPASSHFELRMQDESALNSPIEFASMNGNAFLFSSNTDGELVTITKEGNVGIGTIHPNSILQVGEEQNGVFEYFQVDSGTSSPPSSDCGNVSHTGRMYYDYDNNALYICNGSSWRTK